MALIDCYECGKEISSTATACPHCGAPATDSGVQQVQQPGGGSFKRVMSAVFWGSIALAVFVWYGGGDKLTTTPQKKTYLSSHASYAELDRLVGCGSTYSDDKKRDVFNERFKDHWFTWSGQIALVEADSVSLNIDGAGLQDLMVDFLDKRAGYNLHKGQKIKVRFLMKSPGGCFLPFSGVQAEVM